MNVKFMDFFKSFFKSNSQISPKEKIRKWSMYPDIDALFKGIESQMEHSHLREY